MYLFLPSWPIDRLRRLSKEPLVSKDRFGSVPSLCGAPADEPPFATVITAAGRRLIAAINPAASAAGLAPGMPLADALSFLPALATAAAEPEADAAALTRLAEWCGRYSPWTAPDGVDGVKLEVTGCAHLWGGEAALAADLARRLARPLTSTGHIGHRIAIAGTLGAAWALGRFAADSGAPALPDPGDEQSALAPLPVEALRLDPITAAGLRRVGLKRIGELIPMPRDALARRFGEQVARRLDQALGHLPEPLSPLGEAPIRRVRLSFAEPIADPADLARAAERLTDDLVARLAREGMGARRLDLAFHRIDGRVEHIRLGTARPSRDPKHLAGLFAAKLDTVDPGLGVEDMILAVFAAEPLAAEQMPLNPSLSAAAIGLPPPPYPHPSLPRMRGREGEGAGEGWVGGLAPLLDRIGARLGLAAVSRIEARQSHLPECASIAMNIAAKPPPQPPACGGGSRNGRAGAFAKPPRPVRLFAPPEPIEALWVLPDDPPFSFTWRRRPHRVRRADGPERIAEEWWNEADNAPISFAWASAVRDYYRVEDEEGRRFWLVRAGLPGGPPPRWFVHGVFA
jgi:protein ImuB